jgi:hypothetical protein
MACWMIASAPAFRRFFLAPRCAGKNRAISTGFRLFRVDYSARDLLPMWKRQNQAPIERIVVYDPRSLATVWVVDDASGRYIAVPYRVPRADMTLAESEAARRQLQALKLADRTETRLFESVLQVRAVEERGRTTTARMKAERTRQARRAAAAASVARNHVATQQSTTGAPSPSLRAQPPLTVLTSFTDVEDL